MERKRQREIAMAAVAVAIVGIAAYRVRTTFSAPAGAPAAQPAAATSRQPSAPKQQVAEVDLQALQAERPDPVDSTRNPFRFRAKPAPPPPPAPVRPAVPVPIGPITPPPPPPPPRIPLKFIGIVESPRAGRLAILSDGRGVYQGREGETIEGRYRILKIGVESIDLAYIDGRGRQTIRLTGQ
jgi:hypothetical protein